MSAEFRQRIFGVATSQTLKVTPSQMAGKLVFHYSIPNVQSLGSGMVEDGSSISSDKIVIDKPCVLISKLNPRKSTVCLAEPSRELTVASTEFIPLTTGDSDDDRYLAWILRSTGTTQLLSSLVSSATNSHQRVQPFQILGLSVTWPSKDKRIQLTHFLDRETGEIDAMIAKLDRMAETLEVRKISAVQRATQFDANGDRWATVPTAHLFGSIGSGTTPKEERYYTSTDEGVPWVTTSELREREILGTSKRVTPQAISDLASLKVHPRGSIAIAMYGATIGRLGTLGVDAVTNQACCVFSEPIHTDPRFFYFSLWGQRDDIIRLAVGGGQPNISQSMLRRWKVPCPLLEEQKRIADHLDNVTGKIDAMLAKTAELKSLLTERRAALITDVVTGRKEVA